VASCPAGAQREVRQLAAGPAIAPWGGMTKTAPIKVVCMECGKKFSTRAALPSCPKCNGSDVEVR